MILVVLPSGARSAGASRDLPFTIVTVGEGDKPGRNLQPGTWLQGWKDRQVGRNLQGWKVDATQSRELRLDRRDTGNEGGNVQGVGTEAGCSIRYRDQNPI
jgi:hypothetical protein